MPSVTYMNGPSAPFWDFIANLEQQGQNHPFFSQHRNQDAERGEEGHSAHPSQPPFGPWGWGHSGFGTRGFPHRGPPGPPPQDAQNEKDTEKEGDNVKDADKDNGEGPSGGSGSDNEGCAPSGRSRHGRCGAGRRGRHSHGGPCGHYGRGWFGPYQGASHHHGRRGGWGGMGRHGPFNGSSFNPFEFAAGLFEAGKNENDATGEAEDFTPEADIFDTESDFVIHVSLPGAKKEDVGVNWNADKSELAIAGVIYRPGSEEFLKTLATNERKVGPFERKIRLGTRANPAQIDADMITAKLEDGVLRVQVPKMEAGFVEIKKVEIE